LHDYLFSLVALEGGIRILGIAPSLPDDYGGYIQGEFHGITPKPFTKAKGTVSTGEFDYLYEYNSKGFRDAEHEYDKQPGVFRILATGDSFTFGVGAEYEQTYLRHLEILLNELAPPGKSVEIIKAGISGYWMRDEYILLDYYLPKYKPDLGHCSVASSSWRFQ
jgi:hypothetical protein